jgi:hypothetical protein
MFYNDDMWVVKTLIQIFFDNTEAKLKSIISGKRKNTQ